MKEEELTLQKKQSKNKSNVDDGEEEEDDEDDDDEDDDDEEEIELNASNRKYYKAMYMLNAFDEQKEEESYTVSGGYWGDLLRIYIFIYCLWLKALN